MCRWKEREQEGGKVVWRGSDMPSYAGLGCTLYVPVCVYTTPWDMGSTEGGACTDISTAENAAENDIASVSGFL